MSLRFILLAPFCLVSCSISAPVPLTEFQHIFPDDPVFAAMLRDPKVRAHLNDPEFWQSFRDPQVRWQLRMEQSARMYPPPSENIVARVEQALSEMNCVGSLESWDRLYTNGQDIRRGGIDPNRLTFSLRQAGVHGFKPGRSIVPPSKFYSIDDRPYPLVHGQYDIAADKLTLKSCGDNSDS